MATSGIRASGLALLVVASCSGEPPEPRDGATGTATQALTCDPDDLFSAVAAVLVQEAERRCGGHPAGRERTDRSAHVVWRRPVHHAAGATPEPGRSRGLDRERQEPDVHAGAEHRGHESARADVARLHEPVLPRRRQRVVHQRQRRQRLPLQESDLDEPRHRHAEPAVGGRDDPAGGVSHRWAREPRPRLVHPAVGRRAVAVSRRARGDDRRRRAHADVLVRPPLA